MYSSAFLHNFLVSFRKGTTLSLTISSSLMFMRKSVKNLSTNLIKILALVLPLWLLWLLWRLGPGTCFVFFAKRKMPVQKRQKQNLDLIHEMQWFNLFSSNLEFNPRLASYYNTSFARSKNQSAQNGLKWKSYYNYGPQGTQKYQHQWNISTIQRLYLVNYLYFSKL